MSGESSRLFSPRSSRRLNEGIRLLDSTLVNIEGLWSLWNSLTPFHLCLRPSAASVYPLNHPFLAKFQKIIVLTEDSSASHGLVFNYFVRNKTFVDTNLKFYCQLKVKRNMSSRVFLTASSVFYYFQLNVDMSRVIP